jgi:spore maturation protein CgeB
MNKLLKASFYYSGVITELYKDKPYLSTMSYSKQYEVMQNLNFAWSDSWKIELEKTGRYHVEEIVTNNEVLQKQWAKENHINYSDSEWALSILEAQILNYQPTILFILDYINIPTAFIRKIKKKCPSIKLTMSWDGVGLNDKNIFSAYDLILSCIPTTCDYYGNNGFKSYYMTYFFDNRILPKLDLKNKKHDFSFVGSLSTWNGLHHKRLNLIKNLVCKTPLKIWSPDKPEHGKFYKYPQRKRLLNANFKEFWQIYNLGKSWQGTAYGLDMYQILSNSKITFNCHGDIVPNFAANIRLWEATGVGTCLITDWKENLTDFFEIDKEIVTYKNLGECVEKVKFLLSHDSIRQSIAEAGQKRTLREYSPNKILESFEIYLINHFSL